jgi:hypothetical protein
MNRQVSRAIQANRTLMREREEEELQAARRASSAVATEDTLEDGMMHMSGLEGEPDMRCLLLAIMGLDDVLASGQLGDTELAELRELQGRLRGRFEAADADGLEESNDYKEATYLISHVYSFIEYKVYEVLSVMNMRMCADEAEREAIEEAIRVAAEEEAARVRAALEAEANAAVQAAAEAAKPRVPTEAERRAIAAARVARFGGGGSA